MTPIQINVNVSLSEDTLSALKHVADIFAAVTIASKSVDAAMAKPAEDVKPATTEAPKPAPVKTEPVKAEPVQPEPVEDLPDFGDDLPEGDPVVVTAQQVCDAVYAAKQRGVKAKPIKAVLTEFGIESSRECPEDKRAALLSRINAL